jgi:tetratricopeptide (TPR) repeat protein
MKIRIAFFCFAFCSLYGYSQASQIRIKQHQEKIIETYLVNGAWQYHYLDPTWENWINKGLEQDSTIAYLWQQKALPLWKQKKYGLAVSCMERASKYDRKTWLARQGFLKCIFAKDYKDALSDLLAYQSEFGSTYVQDHPIEFYAGLCYLQLNQFERAQTVLSANINQQRHNGFTDEWIHYLDRFYLGIAFYEMQNYQLAIKEFDAALASYPQFADASYYKSICLHKLGKSDAAVALAQNGLRYFEEGYTFNEDSNAYEDYPYQVTWQWQAIISLMK